MIKYYLIEFKYRFYLSIYSFIFNFLFCISYLKEILYITLLPINEFHGLNFIFTEITNAFLSYFNLILIYSLILSSPFIIINFFIYAIPSLYNYEFTLCKYLLVGSAILLTFALLFINNLFLPLILKFFFKFEILQYPFKIFFEGRIDTYLNFLIKIYSLFLLMFQFPIALLLAYTLNLINLKLIFHYRKIFYFLFLVIAAILTPPDIISQLLLIIPFILFFELTIFFMILASNYIKLNYAKHIK